jgi:hypothetical protein
MNKSMNKEYISPPFRSSDLSLSLLFFSFLFFSSFKRKDAYGTTLSEWSGWMLLLLLLLLFLA